MLVWAWNSRHLLFARDKAGDENWCLWSLEVETRNVVALTPEEGATAYVQQMSRHLPSEVLVAHNGRDKTFFDLHRIDVATGASTQVEQNEGFFGYVTDQQLRVRFAKRYTDDGGVEFLGRSASKAWVPTTHVPPSDTLTTWPVEFSDDGTKLYWIDSRGRDKAAAVSQDMTTGTFSVLAEDAQADISGLLLHPQTSRPIASACAFDRTRWTVLDPDYQPDFDILAERLTGDLIFNDASDDGETVIVASVHDTRALEYHRYDRASGTVRKLFSAQPRLDGIPLRVMEPVVVRARDGLDLLCYLTRPEVDAAGAGPMILLVHGGPWSRDFWGLNPMHQWLANRGYAVLSVNFRGSTGFGKAFVNAANMEWGGKMHDDLIDAVDWTVMQGIADPARVAIMGGSYGGYAALVGLTATPEKFACAVDLVGISNLLTFTQALPDYWRSWQSEWKVRMGDFTTEEGRLFLQERSPLNHVGRIVRPLLIAHGANDVRVKVSESDQIVAAMQKRGIPVTYILYPDEGHGIERAENRRSYTAVVEAFLALHLGGRCEPVGEDFIASSIQFKAGRELVG